MPTGYTAGILDGSIKDFKQFATLCMRAFGATIHMRDAPFDMAYEERKPGDYHEKAIAKASQELKDAESMSDEVILYKRRRELQESTAYHEKAIAEAKVNRARLNEMLAQAEAYQPPTPEHKGVKDFMIDQIKKTLDFDTATKYHEDKIAEIIIEISTMTADSARSQMKEKAFTELAYHQKELNLEIKRCNDSNKWVEDFIKSLEKQTSINSK
jgi:hypothetical protein